MFPDAKHAAGCVYRVALNQSAYYLGLFSYGESIHDVLTIRDRSRICQVKSGLDFRDRSRIMCTVVNKRKNPYAVALGRKGGKKGGPARAANMTPQERTDSARNAVLARWAKVRQQKTEK
jgi:hypothetical protein